MQHFQPALREHNSTASLVVPSYQPGCTAILLSHTSALPVAAQFCTRGGAEQLYLAVGVLLAGVLRGQSCCKQLLYAMLCTHSLHSVPIQCIHGVTCCLDHVQSLNAICPTLDVPSCCIHLFVKGLTVCSEHLTLSGTHS